MVFRATARDATTNSTTVVKIGGKEKRKKSGCLPRRPETPLQVDESYKNREKKKKEKIWLTPAKARDANTGNLQYTINLALIEP